MSLMERADSHRTKVSLSFQATMSESGHSQPGLYGIERRRRWKEPGSSGPQNLSGPGGRERDYIAPWERERRVSDPKDGVQDSSGSSLVEPPPTSSCPGAVDMSGVEGGGGGIKGPF